MNRRKFLMSAASIAALSTVPVVIAGKDNDLIPCKNPDHPKNYPRTTMICLEDNPIQSVWACKACKEVLKVVSAQVRTKPAYKQHIREQLAKQGRLNTNPFIRPSSFRRESEANLRTVGHPPRSTSYPDRYRR